MDPKLPQLKREPPTAKQTENYKRNLAAYEQGQHWTKLEWRDFDEQLITNLISLVDPEIFQEAIDDIGE